MLKDRNGKEFKVGQRVKHHNVGALKSEGVITYIRTHSIYVEHNNGSSSNWQEFHNIAIEEEPEPVRIKRGIRGEYENHYYVIQGNGFDAKYLHANGTWNCSTSDALGNFPGYFATREAAEQLVKQLGLKVEVEEVRNNNGVEIIVGEIYLNTVLKLLGRVTAIRNNCQVDVTELYNDSSEKSEIWTAAFLVPVIGAGVHEIAGKKYHAYTTESNTLPYLLPVVESKKGLEVFSPKVREALNVLDEALCVNNIESTNLAAALSMLRGPDDSNIVTKTNGTIPVRRALFPKTTQKGFAAGWDLGYPSDTTINVTITEKSGMHYSHHAGLAKTALNL